MLRAGSRISDVVAVAFRNLEPRAMDVEACTATHWSITMPSAEMLFPRMGLKCVSVYSAVFALFTGVMVPTWADHSDHSALHSYAWIENRGSAFFLV